MRYMEGYKTLPTWLENSHSFFSASFLLAKESETFSGQLLQSLIPVIFWIFSPELVGCFVKIIRNDQRPNVASTPPIYKTPWQEKESRKFWPVTNSVQWFILHSHQDDDVWNEWQLRPWKQKRWNSSGSNRTIYKK